jgi:hypothetical protein
MSTPTQPEDLRVEWSNTVYPPNIGFFSEDLLIRAEAVAAQEAYHRKWKYPNKDLTPYTEWYADAKVITLPRELLPRLNEEAQKRQDRPGWPERKEYKGPGIKIHQMGVRGEAAWCQYLGLDIEDIFKFNPKTRFLGDLPIKGTKHAIECKTTMVRMPNPHLKLQPHLKKPRAEGYALAMPNTRFPKDIAALNEILLVGWQSNRLFSQYGEMRVIKTKPVFSLTVDQLQKPSILKEKIACLLANSSFLNKSLAKDSADV